MNKKHKNVKDAERIYLLVRKLGSVGFAIIEIIEKGIRIELDQSHTNIMKHTRKNKKKGLKDGEIKMFSEEILKKHLKEMGGNVKNAV